MLNFDREKLLLKFDYDVFGNWYRFDRFLEERKTKYQTLTMLHHKELGNTLLMDYDIQSSEHDSEYDLGFVSLVPKGAKNVLIVGGGDCSIANMLCGDPKIEHVTVVDIDPDVTEISKKYFPDSANPGEKCTVIHDDAFKYIKSSEVKARPPDVIIDDLFTNPINGGSNHYEVLAKAFPGKFVVSQTDTKLNALHRESMGKIRSFASDVFVTERYVPTYIEGWTFTRYRYVA